MNLTRRLAVCVALTGVLGAACGSDDAGGSSPTDGHVTVFAAASLTNVFTEIGDAFRVANPGTGVTFNFAASSELVAQIGQGAPADVFASADRATMSKLIDAGHGASEPVLFATNRLEIIVAPGNPEAISSVADLARGGLVVITCAPEVPCGAYAAELFANAGVVVTPKSLEQNVKAVVSKVVLGEADAGVVYRTDVAAAGARAAGVAIPDELNVIAEYPIAVVEDAADAAAASAFVAFVVSEQGQAIMASYGFLAP